VGINDGPVTEWMVGNLGATPPLTFDLVAGGRSNLTFRVTDAAARLYVLRRPPISHVLPTAHDMVREHTIISALFPQGVPVPRPLGLCVNEAVNERPFYVMEFVDGEILRDRRQVEAAYDVVRAGLGGLARHDGYIERQLRRWRAQFEQMIVDGENYDGLVQGVADDLARSIPAQQRVSVVHGDYRLDNTVLDAEGKVRAILDWEICSLGDPIADLGLLLVYWTDPGDAPLRPISDMAPTTAEGFHRRDDVLAAYAKHSPLDVSHVRFYQAFGYWKLACIMQGVFARYSAGASAGDQSSVGEYPKYIALLAEAAKNTLEHE